jgi:putative inorganic carbon (HCO3(-)) transporter
MLSALETAEGTGLSTGTKSLTGQHASAEAAPGIGKAAGRGFPILELSLLVAWFAYLLIGPTWGFYWIDSWHNEQRAVQSILLAATGLLSVLVPRFRAALVPRTNTAYALWAVAALGAIAAINASQVSPAFAELSLQVLLVVLAVVIASSVERDPARLSLWARRACVALAVAHVTGIAARYMGMLALERPLGLDVLLLGYANPRFPSALYALLMPFLSALFIDQREIRVLRWIAVAMLVFLWAVNIALGTRAIWFAYGLVLPAAALALGWRRFRPILFTLAGSAIAGLLTYYLLFVAIPEWRDLGSSLRSRLEELTYLSDRTQLWAQAWQIITTKPLFGVGPMNLAALGDSYAAHPHNWVLQLGAEWGIPVLVVSLWILWRLGQSVHARLRVDKNSDLDLFAPLVATLVGLVYGLVDGNLVMPVSQTAFAMTLGVLLGVRTGPATASVARHPLLLSATSAAVVLATTLCLLFYTAKTLPQQGENERSWRLTSKYPDLAPRFWQQGLLR